MNCAGTRWGSSTGSSCAPVEFSPTQSKRPPQSRNSTLMPKDSLSARVRDPYGEGAFAVFTDNMTGSRDASVVDGLAGGL